MMAWRKYQVRNSDLILSHPCVKKAVDFSILFEFLNDKVASARVQFKKMRKSHKYIACIATIGQKGFIGLGKGYGIIIPLEDKKLRAYPFSENVYHKMLWAKDSQSIYYYAQPVAGCGNGTIYKLNTAFDKH